MVRLDQYAKIKNNYCIAYFGNSNEYLTQLRLLRPIFEQRFDTLNIYYCCKDECIKYLNDEKSLTVAELREKRHEFAHIKELTFDGTNHPVLQLLAQSGIDNYTIPVVPAIEHTNICLIQTLGSYPTVGLLKQQVKTLQKIAFQKGYEVEINGDWRRAGLVYGVESVEIFEAAAAGLKTHLIPTGNGERLYKNMFIDGDVLHI